MIPSLIAIHCLKLSNVKFIGSEFLLGYLGIFLGFSFSILTFVLSVVDKVKQSIEPNYTVEQKETTQNRIKKFVDEQFDMLFFLFCSFIFVVLIMVVEVVNLSNALSSINIYIDKSKIFHITKINLLDAAKFSIFALSIYGIYDLLIGTMRFYMSSDGIINRESKK